MSSSRCIININSSGRRRLISYYSSVPSSLPSKIRPSPSSLLSSALLPQNIILSLHHQHQTCYLSTQSKDNDKGYKSFGSFHSDNVEELIRLPEEEYKPPELPFEVADKIKHTITCEENLTTTPLPFANTHQYIQAYSHLDRKQWTFLNHGAFGLALDVGLERAHAWRIFLEKQPLRYFDRYLLNHLVYSARCMVDFVTRDDADARSRIREGTALIPNVTSGMNAVVGGHARIGNRNSLVFYYVSTKYLPTCCNLAVKPIYGWHFNCYSSLYAFVVVVLCMMQTTPRILHMVATRKCVKDIMEKRMQ